MATTLLGIQHHEPEKQTVVVEMPINWQEQELIREAANPNQNSSERFQKVFADTLLAKISAVCCLQPSALANGPLHRVVVWCILQWF